MWLIECSSLELKYFVSDEGAPPYVVLSHVWGQDEVSFRDMQDGQSVHSKRGREKIRMTCALAMQDGFEYAWIDTCCIDKTSSAELSEAINSMYAWYERAERCYVHMVDVPGDCDIGLRRLDAFRRSRWFTRGWTLQELLAPSCVEFRNHDWNLIGALPLLVLTVADVTGIDQEVLLHEKRIERCCMAKRLSWASERMTTRIEDTAYCLLGLCGINMPLLYGERERAFQRFQEELLRTTNDQSLLAWNDSGPRTVLDYVDGDLFVADSNRRFWNDIVPPGFGFNFTTGPLRLARSPAAFTDCSLIETRIFGITDANSTKLDKRGFRAQLPLIPIGDAEGRYFLAQLGCVYMGSTPGVVGLLLYRRRQGNNSLPPQPYDTFLCVSKRGQNREAFVVTGFFQRLDIGLCQDVLILWESLNLRGPDQCLQRAPELARGVVRLDLRACMTLLDGHPRASWNLRAGYGVLGPDDPFGAVEFSVSGSDNTIRNTVLVFMERISESSLWPAGSSHVAFPQKPFKLRLFQVAPRTSQRATDSEGSSLDFIALKALADGDNTGPEGKGTSSVNQADAGEARVYVEGFGDVWAACESTGPGQTCIRLTGLLRGHA